MPPDQAMNVHRDGTLTPHLNTSTLPSHTGPDKVGLSWSCLRGCDGMGREPP
jgi:hypothetical protein